MKKKVKIKHEISTWHSMKFVEQYRTEHSSGNLKQTIHQTQIYRSCPPLNIHGIMNAQKYPVDGNQN